MPSACCSTASPTTWSTASFPELKSAHLKFSLLRFSGKPHTPWNPSAILHEVRQLYNVSDRQGCAGEKLGIDACHEQREVFGPTTKVALYARVSTVNGHQDPEMQLGELRERSGWRRVEGISVTAQRAIGVTEKMALWDQKNRENSRSHRFACWRHCIQFQ
jgi:hypothetical protein